MSLYDNFMFNSPWWEKYYGSEIVFQYINNHSSLQEYSNKKGLISQISRLLAGKVSIANIINDFAKIDLLANEKKTVLNEILDIYEKYDAEKTLMEWFRQEKTMAYLTGRSFTSVTEHKYSQKKPLSSVPLKSIDSKFIIVSGSICYKQALSTNPVLLECASYSDCNLILCDYPPLALHKENEEYKGAIINLKVDEGFEDVFSDLVPFDKNIGWFPRCTVAGFINTRKVTTENFPTISPTLIMYKRPLCPTPNAARLAEFISDKINSIHYSENELNSFESRLFLYYLVPTMYRSWRVDYDKIDDKLYGLLKSLVGEDKDKMGDNLLKFYEQYIFSK